VSWRTTVHRKGHSFSFRFSATEGKSMSDDLQRKLASGEYEVDTDAVARAMITRARALRIARRGSNCSQVLVAADRIEVRRVGPLEVDPLPFQRAS